MDKTLKIECTLKGEEIGALALGLGYSDTVVVVDKETGAWSNVENTETHETYLINYFTGLIADKAKEVFVKNKRAELAASVDAEVHAYEEAVRGNIAEKLTSEII